MIGVESAMLVSPAEFFLESVDRAAREKRRSVIQFIGLDDRERPGAVGSGVLLEIAGARLLVTAAHVIDDWAPVTTLYLPGRNGLIAIDSLDFSMERAFDIAVAALPDALATELQNFVFLTEADCQAVGCLHPAYVVALGYPASRNQARWGTPSIRNSPYMIGGMPRSGPLKIVSFRYSKGKNRTRSARQKVIGPDLWGMSGGGVFATRIRSSAELSLVGISTDWVWRRSEVHGCAWPVVIRFIREVLSKA